MSYKEHMANFAALDNAELVATWVHLCEQRASLIEKIAAAEDTMWDRKMPLRAPKKAAT